MPRTVLEIYAAAVCFAAVGCLAISLGVAIYSAIGVAYPEFTAHPMSLAPQPTMPPPPLSEPTAGTQAPSNPVSASPEVVAQRKAAALEAGLRNEELVSRQSLVRWGIAALISAALFFLHWRILVNGRRVGA